MSGLPSRPLLAASVLALLLAGPPADAQQRPPNFVIILADDLGVGDISPFGGWVHTPQLDRLAAEGMRFTDFHSNGVVCSPTRAALLTGRYQQRAGLESVLYAAPDHPRRNRGHGLQLRELTFAEMLRDAGYATGMTGKWHLGYERSYNPVFNGFDRFNGYVSGNVDYFSHVDGAGFYDWWDGDRLVNEPGYATHLITRHSVRFIEQHRDRPFVLYVAHEAPHYPYQGPKDRPFRLVGGENQHGAGGDSAEVRRAYREMVEEMDRGVGEIVDALRQNDLAANTLVVFLSDNGALRYGSNGSLRGFKGSVWEGGHRVPAIAWWPGRIAPGSSSAQPAMGFDLVPTMLALAGAGVPFEHRLDGVSLLPALQGRTLPGERTLIWQYEGQAAVREGRWKVVVGAREHPAAALFDLQADPGETTDLAARHPERLRRMLQRLEEWRRDVLNGATAQPQS